MIAIVYFVLWRPSSDVRKSSARWCRRRGAGDVVVTTGGLIGKVTKSVDDNEVEFEIAPNVRARLARSGIAEVRAKGEPVKDTAPPPRRCRPRKMRPTPEGRDPALARIAPLPEN